MRDTWELCVFESIRQMRECQIRPPRKQNCVITPPRNRGSSCPSCATIPGALSTFWISDSDCVSERLHCRPHDDLVDIDIGRLLDGKGDGSGNGIGFNRVLRERFDPLRGAGIGDMID